MVSNSSATQCYRGEFYKCIPSKIVTAQLILITLQEDQSIRLVLLNLDSKDVTMENSLLTIEGLTCDTVKSFTLVLPVSISLYP